MVHGTSQNDAPQILDSDLGCQLRHRAIKSVVQSASANRESGGVITFPQNRWLRGPAAEVLMSPFTRRDFLKTSIAAGTMASFGTLSLNATRRTATDVVTLGKS